MSLIGKILSSKFVFNRLVKRAEKTPYSDITSKDGDEIYMRRLWVFNPYSFATGREINFMHKAFWKFLPSIRLHHIMREDLDRDLHDHPWNARTYILRGWYLEEREDGHMYFRHEGDTAKLRFGEFHRIEQVSPGGVWTMFITWKYQGTWGFKVDGKKIPYREYLANKGYL